MTIAPHVAADVSPSARDVTGLLADAVRLVEQAALLLTDADVGPQSLTGAPQLRTSGDALRQLLHGAESALVDLGCPVADSRVVCLRAKSAGALDVFMERCHHERRLVATRMTNDTIAVMVPGTPRQTGVDAAMRGATALLMSLERTVAATWNAGISSPLGAPSQLASAWGDAFDAAIIAADTGRRHVAADDAWAAITARRLRDALPTSRTCNSALDRLAAYDADHDTDLGRTLGVWLRSNCDTSASAGTLHIHANTLRYRVARAATVAGLDLNDPDQRLVLQLAYSERDTA